MIILLLNIVVIYLIAGFMFAVLFAFRWLRRFDVQAENAPISFRLLILPASCILWPYLLLQLYKKKIL